METVKRWYPEVLGVALIVFVLVYQHQIEAVWNGIFGHPVPTPSYQTYVNQQPTDIPSGYDFVGFLCSYNDGGLCKTSYTFGNTTVAYSSVSAVDFTISTPNGTNIIPLGGKDDFGGDLSFSLVVRDPGPNQDLVALVLTPKK